MLTDNIPLVVGSYDDLYALMEQQFGTIVGLCQSQYENLGNYYGSVRISAVDLDYSDNQGRHFHSPGNIIFRNYGGNLFYSNTTNVNHVDSRIDSQYCYKVTIFPDVSSGSNSSSDIPQEYTEFWFPLVSIGAFCAICWLLYRIIIKRLLP